MRKVFGLLLMMTPLFGIAQDLQTVTQNGNATTLGINVGGASSIFGLNFNLPNSYTKQIVPTGYNFWLSTGAEDGKLMMPYNNAENARFQNLGLVIDNNVGIGTTSPSYKLDVRGDAFANGYLISSMANADIGGTLQLSNPAKTANGAAKDWRIYNMGGAYGNSLQFWAYDAVGCAGGLCDSRFTLMDNGNVGIGTTTPNEKLAVNGKIRAKEIKVETANWPDYVLENTYIAPSLLEIETYIKANKRLPEMPSAKEVEANGVELGEMNKLLLKKVEELTLLLIDQNKKNEKQEEAIGELKKELEKIKSKK